jgi:hypothetical protein
MVPVGLESGVRHDRRVDRLRASNLPAFLLAIALLVAALHRGRWSTPERFLSWFLLLPVGVTALWAAVFHLFFPSIAAADIGWEVSPFQVEVGMADLAIGATAFASFSLFDQLAPAT